MIDNYYTVHDAIRDVRGMEIDDNESGDVFASAVIIMYGIATGTVSYKRIKGVTRGFCSPKRLRKILINLKNNGIYNPIDGGWDIDGGGTDDELFLGFALAAMAGAGKIRRVLVPMEDEINTA